MSYIKMSLGIALVFVLAGCAEPPPSGSGTAHNFTLLLACNGTALLNVSVTGNARIRNRDLADSNCSLHVSRDIVTIRCPQSDGRTFRLAESGASLLNLSTHRVNMQQR